MMIKTIIITITNNKTIKTDEQKGGEKKKQKTKQFNTNPPSPLFLLYPFLSLCPLPPSSLTCNASQCPQQ